MLRMRGPPGFFAKPCGEASWLSGVPSGLALGCHPVALTVIGLLHGQQGRSMKKCGPCKIIIDVIGKA